MYFQYHCLDIQEAVAMQTGNIFTELKSRTKLMIHFVFWRKFRVEIPPIAMLKADENFIDELTSMSSFSNQHCHGGRGALAVKGSSLHTGKASFNAKNICPNEFCPRLWDGSCTPLLQKSTGSPLKR